MNAETFGDYTEVESGEENLSLAFSPSSRPIKDRWRNNGLSADFVADYFITFLPKETDASGGRENEIKGAVSYIANELLENAMKFCNTEHDQPVTLRLDLNSDQLRFTLVNRTIAGQGEVFTTFLQEFCSMDPGEFFVIQMERNIESDTSSGLGFATMINDYGAQLGWKIETDSDNTSVITTHVTLNF